MILSITLTGLWHPNIHSINCGQELEDLNVLGEQYRTLTPKPEPHLGQSGDGDAMTEVCMLRYAEHHQETSF